MISQDDAIRITAAQARQAKDEACIQTLINDLWEHEDIRTYDTALFTMMRRLAFIVRTFPFQNTTISYNDNDRKLYLEIASKYLKMLYAEILTGENNE